MADRLVVAPVRRSRLSQQIVVQLCQMIRHGQLRPGDRLPPERELAEQLEVSRASLREALRVLELAGVVDVRHGGGTAVREFADDGLLSPLMLLLDVRGDLIGDLLEARIMFEPAVAARAAVRADPEHLAELERLVRQQEGFVRDGVLHDPWLDSDRAFHIAVARASRNEVAVRMTRLITEMLHDGRRHFAASAERLRHAWERHRQILDAVRAGDTRAASEAMLEHLREVEAYVLEGVVSAQRAVPLDDGARTGTKGGA